MHSFNFNIFSSFPVYDFRFQSLVNQIRDYVRNILVEVEHSPGLHTIGPKEDPEIKQRK